MLTSRQDMWANQITTYYKANVYYYFISLLLIY